MQTRSGFVEAAAPTITGIVGWAVTRDEETQQLRVEGLYDPACATLELVYTRLPAAS